MPRNAQIKDIQDIPRNMQIKAILKFLEIYRLDLYHYIPRNIQIKAIPVFLEIYRSKISQTFLEICRSKMFSHS